MYKIGEDQAKQEYAFWIAIGVILLGGFLLRILQLEQYPLAVNQDELSNIYDGYSIAETGADRWGNKYPMILKAFGLADYRPPMYAWLSAVTIRAFGFSISSGRLVSALLGSASLGLLFLVARRAGGRLFGFLSLLITALSPWHILFSRIASEGAILPSFFIISGCYLWQKARDKNYQIKHLALLGLCIGLGANTYQAGKLTSFLFAALVFVDLLLRCKSRYKCVIAFGVSCLVGASPQIIIMLTMASQFFSRASMSSVPFAFSFEYFNTILKNIASNVSPDFLFFSSTAYNNLSVARLLTVEVLFFYVGLFFIYKVIDRSQVLTPFSIYFLLFASIIPGALTVDNPHALRSSGLAILLPLITAAGIKVVYVYIKQNICKKIFITASVVIVLWNAIYFIEMYIESENLRSQGMQVLLVKSSKKLNDFKDNYDKIYVEITGNQQYIYLLSYCNIKPREFQTADIEMNYGDWDDFRRLGKYYFVNQSEIEEKAKDDKATSLLLLRTRTNNYEAIDSVEHMSEKMFFYKRQASIAP